MEHDESRSAQDPRSRTSELADQVVDELMPEDLDWRHLARLYPFPVVVLALTTGFILGRHRGQFLLAAVAGLAIHRATKDITEAFERVGITIPVDEPGSPSQD